MKKTVCILLLAALIISSMHSCRQRAGRNNSRSSSRDAQTTETTRGKTVVKMRKEGGVYHVPCKINGAEMEFIFDTGASNITISLVEALYLYKQGKLKDEDFQGTAQYQIADGSISEGSIIQLRTVEIGGKKLTNVKASIVHNMDAPLLLGQSALAKFGKISINYQKNEIIFEQ
ncbi:MAG: retroviral-like aspartic protease family protein [Prevotellaceae bacterium]|jgi:aspartyl protease family protein|nr:retroviral-like aspartic protease family protein [Prevotellaceae bacterium]